MQRLQNLIVILDRTRALLALADSDFSSSCWKGQKQALSEVDSVIAELEHGSVPDMRVLYAPAGPIQKVRLSSGCGDKFLELADHFDKEYEIVKNQP